ncbi:MAG: hypothetical protein MZV64_17555 [Ignavibacteriales bacterium]|nr:hypothetical protein [Ignavibacteriales bacterium]
MRGPIVRRPQADHASVPGAQLDPDRPTLPVWEGVFQGVGHQFVQDQPARDGLVELQETSSTCTFNLNLAA